MLTPSGRVVVSVPLVPTDRRLWCAYVELPNPTFWQKNHHSYGNKLHKVQESAASAVGDKHQAGTNVII